MPLHNTEDLKAEPTSALEAEVHDEVAETYVFPEARQDPQEVYQTIHDQLVLDGNSQQNLATFCTTWIEPEVKLLMDESADKNMIDKDEYPQTAAIEERCVHMLADLWNSPEAASTIGCSTTGSSEAAMLGGPGAEVEVAEAAGGGGEIDREAEPDHGAGAGVLAQVLPLLRCGNSRGADGGRAAAADAGRSAQALRREHDRRGGDAGRDVHAAV